MNKLTLEVRLPAANRSFDVMIPAQVPFRDLFGMIAQAMASLSGDEFMASADSMLFDATSGTPVPQDKTAMQLRMLNGHKLVLM